MTRRNFRNAPAMFIHGVTETGGAERELLLIVDRLPQFGYRPLVVSPGQGPLVEELNRQGTEVRFAPMPPWRKLFAYPGRANSLRALREVIVAERPVLLHVNDIWWVPQTLVAATGTGVPILAHARQEVEPRKVRRYELDRSDLVLAVSGQIHRSLEQGGVPKGRLRTLHSGLDLDYIPLESDSLEIRQRLGIPEDALLL